MGQPLCAERHRYFKFLLMGLGKTPAEAATIIKEEDENPRDIIRKVLDAPKGFIREAQNLYNYAVNEGSVDAEKLLGFVMRERRKATVTFIARQASSSEPSSSRVTFEEATSILGSGNVLSAEAAGKAWVRTPANTILRYLPETIRRRAAENLRDGKRWRLVYLFGFTAEEMVLFRGTDPRHPPAIVAPEGWVGDLAGNHELGESRVVREGYYLVDFSAVWLGGVSFESQDEKIAAQKLKRLNDCAAIEAALSFWMSSGELIFKDVQHWGRSKMYGGNVIISSTKHGVAIACLKGIAMTRNRLGAAVVAPFDC